MTRLNSEPGNENVTPVNDRIAHMLFGSPYPKAHWLRRVGRFFAAAWWLWAIALGSTLLLFLGCATVQTPQGKVWVLPEHAGGALCKRWAGALGYDHVAATIERPIMCDKEAAEKPCLVRHELEHAKEQQAHRYGVPGWLWDYEQEWAACLKQGRSPEDCHRNHSMETTALIVQGACEAEMAAKVAGGAR